MCDMKNLYEFLDLWHFVHTMKVSWSNVVLDLANNKFIQNVLF